MNIKRYLFPFLNKNEDLKKYWWHRLLTVIFFVTIIFGLFFFWTALNREEMGGYSGCLKLGYSMHNDWEQVNLDCERVYPIHSLFNFAFSFSLIVFLWYLLQTIYYKIFLYIVIGNKNSKK